MPFRARNTYYLRISARAVLPLYLYLDDRHTDWMSDRVLQLVLADLRPLIVPKLKAEADAHVGPGGLPNGKKGTVDVHRGETYQFAFFFRKTEPHSVVIKTRIFIAAPPPPIAPARVPPTETSSPRVGKRKGRSTVQKRQIGRGKVGGKKSLRNRQHQPSDEEELSGITSEDDDATSEGFYPYVSAPRRSGRTKRLVAPDYREGESDLDGFEDVEISSIPEKSNGESHVAQANVKNEEEEAQLSSAALVKTPQVNQTPNPPPQIQIDAGEDEEKPKPLLDLRYQGFEIYGRCLCIVVEPWPALPSSRATSVIPSKAKIARRIAPPDFVSSTESATRARTPLFLPEFDRDRSETPFPFVQPSIMSPFNDPLPTEDEDDNPYGEAGLLEFSQVLNNTGVAHAGSADDDEIDGAVLFGDADEAREL